MKEPLSRPQTSKFFQALQLTRTVCLSLLEPVDYASRVINNKRHFPPLPLSGGGRWRCWSCGPAG